jgi:polyribonucleotide nucleotidyltransferase
MSPYTFALFGTPATWHFKKFNILANSSVYATWGNTAINVTVLRGKAREGMDFFPLQVEYIEKLYAAGMIASSPYVKREGFPSQEAILRGRVIDRALRPRFPKELLDDVQVYIHVLAYEKEHDPMILGFNTAVAALMASDIPFEGELAGVRVSLDDSQNPYLNAADVTSLAYSSKGLVPEMNMVISVDKEGVVMFDADMAEVSEEKSIEAVKFARDNAEHIYTAQKEFAAMVATEKKQGAMFTLPEGLVDSIKSEFATEIKEAISQKTKEKRKSMESEVKEKVTAKFKEDETVTGSILAEALSQIMKKEILHEVLDEHKRIDGRQFNEVRTLSGEVGIIPQVHGTGLFKRGDTHVLSLVTLAAPTKSQTLEDMTGEDTKMYIHEYSAPPAAYGETGRYNTHPGRREIGHGALAEKALERVLPSVDEFPYMIRVVSEVVSSAGSTSMASTCGSTLALLDAGVPLKTPVAGISVGVIANDDFSQYQLLTDIEEIEDFFGYMDFKVAGSRTGITAIQMDQKKLRIPYEVIFEAFGYAKTAREQILDVIVATIPTHRAELAATAPRVDVIRIDPDNIGKLIGPGGKMIKEITKQSGMEINIKEDGTVEIFGVGQENRDRAKQMIDDIFGDFKVGEVYDAEVIGIKPFGAIVRIAKGNMDEQGLVHISELADKFIKTVEEVVNMGDMVKVKVVGIDENGRLRLSVKQVK